MVRWCVFSAPLSTTIPTELERVFAFQCHCVVAVGTTACSDGFTHANELGVLDFVLFFTITMHSVRGCRLLVRGGVSNYEQGYTK